MKKSKSKKEGVTKSETKGVRRSREEREMQREGARRIDVDKIGRSTQHPLNTHPAPQLLTFQTQETTAGRCTGSGKKQSGAMKTEDDRKK